MIEANPLLEKILHHIIMGPVQERPPLWINHHRLDMSTRRARPNRYTPHQGAQEKARRVKQMEKANV